MENNQALTPMEDKNQFYQALNACTDNEQIQFLPSISFNASTGYFGESIGKDDDGQTSFKDHGTEIKVHYITSMKKLQIKNGRIITHQTREFKKQDEVLELFDENKKIADRGTYKQLRNNHPGLKEATILYVFFNDNPYRIKLSGSKVVHWFEFRNQMAKDRLAIPAFEIFIYRGKLAANERGEQYHEVLFRKGDELPQDMVVDRVNLMMDYVKSISFSQEVEDYDPETNGTVEAVKRHFNGRVVSDPELIGSQEEDIKVENIPF